MRRTFLRVGAVAAAIALAIVAALFFRQHSMLYHPRKYPAWGTAVALDFATHHRVQRIVLIAAYTTLREEAATVVGTLLSHLLLENYDNRARLAELAHRSPTPRVEIFHGTNDEVIPFRMGQELAREFPALVRFHPVAVGDHVGPLYSAAWEILDAMNR